jgi:STE24 endopeptidase
VNEDKATRYQRLKRRASVMSLAWGLLLLVGLLVTGGSIGLRALAERVAGAPGAGALHALASRTLYLALLGALDEAIALPLAFYSGFLLEHRYSLSTEPLGRWARQRAKALLLGAVFGLVAFQFVYGLLDWWPQWWWVITGAAFTVVTILLANLGPVLLLPLFYRFAPLARGELRARLVALASRAGVRVVDAFEWRLSDRTRKANAALTGLGRTRRILVSDTLLAEYSDDEIEMVLAHELGHHVQRDIWKGIAFETVLALAGFYVAARMLSAFAPLAGLRGVNDIAGLPLLTLGATAVSLVCVPLANAVSRRQERRADRYALALGDNAPAFMSAMRRLASQNLVEERPTLVARIFFYSHPPVAERIEAARRFSRP